MTDPSTHPQEPLIVRGYQYIPASGWWRDIKKGSYTHDPCWSDQMEREWRMSNFLYYHGEAQVWTDEEWDRTTRALEHYYDYLSPEFRAEFPAGEIKEHAFSTTYSERLKAAARAWRKT